MPEHHVWAYLMFPIWAVAIAGLGLAAATVGWRVMAPMLDDPLVRLMEILSRGAFGFVIFLLALTLASVRENFLETESTIGREALELRQLVREIQSDPADPRAPLVAAYAMATMDRDWPALASSRPSLAPEASAALAALRAECAGSQLAVVGRIEDLREARLRHARSVAPTMFWTVIAAVLAIAAFLHGRTPQTRGQRIALGLYLSSFGLVIALIREFERPFWGWVQAGAEPIAEVAILVGN